MRPIVAATLLVLALTTTASAQEADGLSPEQVAKKYFTALFADDVVAASALVHPRDAVAFKASFVAIGKEAWGSPPLERMWKVLFPQYPTLEAFEKATPQAVVQTFMRMLGGGNRELIAAMKRGKLLTHGLVQDGKDTVHVLYAVTGTGLKAVDGYTLAAILARAPAGWRLVLGSKGRTLESLVASVRKRLKLKPAPWTGLKLVKPIAPLPATSPWPKDSLEADYVGGVKALIKRDWKRLVAAVHPKALAAFHKRVWATVEKHRKRKGFEPALIEEYPDLKGLKQAKALSHADFFLAFLKPLLKDAPTSLDAYQGRFVGKLVKGDRAWLLVDESLAGDRSVSVTPLERHDGKWLSLFDPEWEQTLAMIELGLSILGDDPDD